MENNKEEALTAKIIAEKKFSDKDIVGAKSFALKAQNLDPDLDGIIQFLATLDVFISAEKTSTGDVDYYKVLGVDPLADDNTIKQQYRKLSLLLHPDKNKSVGADGAFKILSDVWSLLADKTKRIAYDQKQKMKDMCQRFPDWRSSATDNQNSFPEIFSNNTSYTCSPNGAIRPKPVPSPPFSNSNTFWTTCDACKLQFEYLRMYMNHNLRCDNCQHSFLAVEVPPPPIHGSNQSASGASFMQPQNSNPNSMVENSDDKEKKPVPVTNMGGTAQPGTFSDTVSSQNIPSAAFSATLHDKFKRKYEEASTTSFRGETFQLKPQPHKKKATSSAPCFLNPGSSSVLNSEGVKKKKRDVEEPKTDKHAKEKTNQTGKKSGFSTLGFHKGGFVGQRGISTRELSQVEVRYILISRSKKDIHSKLKEWNSLAGLLKTSEMASIPSRSQKEMKKEILKQKGPSDGMKADANRKQEFVDVKISANINMSSSANHNDTVDTEEANPLSMTVPDSDFHDFDHDRTEMSFGKNQVWAVYDDDDGMPRFYALIHQVMSMKPFGVQISWLNSKSNHELAPVNWISSGFYKTIGDFWIGKHEVNKSLNSFSHKVNWTKGFRGTIKIYPRKGDVWALYKNWSPKWNELTPEEVIHKYSMVEVLEAYIEERGVTVVPLVKVVGYKAVFRKHSDPTRIRTIPKEEMFRFSHMVPSYLLTGQEGHNAPQGCWELDPASTPMELLQILTEVEVEETIKTADKAEEESHYGDCKRLEDEELVKCENISEGNHVEVSARSDKAEVTKNNVTLVYKRRRYRK
ncbi:hypothetical protein K2173_027483 [Erythroxylum novogranatense]|uniref:J domain-containing protein n=1 Tax=Erythroxylum novogranatense TaxID=1862640 RepID=A0AAV8U0I7_9ROSI|nr:hypothetical protein K2173_027483 [Erythroxylum novogranatense]